MAKQKKENPRGSKSEKGLQDQLSITAAKIEEYKDVFDVFDVNKDGLITKQELGQVLSTIGVHFTEKQLKRFMAKANNRDDDKVTFYEFMKLLMRPANGSDEERLFEAFKLFDVDQDGFISPKELKEALEKMGEKMTYKEAEEMVKMADINDDGKIDYGEFVVMMLD